MVKKYALYPTVSVGSKLTFIYTIKVNFLNFLIGGL